MKAVFTLDSNFERGTWFIGKRTHRFCFCLNLFVCLFVCFAVICFDLQNLNHIKLMF